MTTTVLVRTVGLAAILVLFLAQVHAASNPPDAGHVARTVQARSIEKELLVGVSESCPRLHATLCPKIDEGAPDDYMLICNEHLVWARKSCRRYVVCQILLVSHTDE